MGRHQSVFKIFLEEVVYSYGRRNRSARVSSLQQIVLTFYGMDTLSSYQYTGEKDPYNANAFKVTSCYLSSFGDNFLSTKTPLGSARHYDMPIQQDRYSSEPHDIKCVDGLHPRLMLKILHQHGYVCKTLTSLVFLSEIF